MVVVMNPIWREAVHGQGYRASQSPPKPSPPSQRRCPTIGRLSDAPDGKGGFLIVLPADVLNRLKAMRGPGESYSDVILRLARG